MTIEACLDGVSKVTEAATGWKAHIVAGEAALDDYCDEDGWGLIISVEGFVPVMGFPTEWGQRGGSDGVSIVPPQQAVQLHVLVAHCVPTVNDDGEAPEKRIEAQVHRDLLSKSAKVWTALAALTPLALVGEAAPFVVLGGVGFIDIPLLADVTEWCEGD